MRVVGRSMRGPTLLLLGWLVGFVQECKEGVTVVGHVAEIETCFGMLQPWSGDELA